VGEGSHHNQVTGSPHSHCLLPPCILLLLRDLKQGLCLTAMPVSAQGQHRLIISHHDRTNIGKAPTPDPSRNCDTGTGGGHSAPLEPVTQEQQEAIQPLSSLLHRNRRKPFSPSRACCTGTGGGHSSCYLNSVSPSRFCKPQSPPLPKQKPLNLGFEIPDGPLQPRQLYFGEGERVPDSHSPLCEEELPDIPLPPQRPASHFKLLSPSFWTPPSPHQRK